MKKKQYVNPTPIPVFKKGQKVIWESQARGHTIIKKGVVVWVMREKDLKAETNLTPRILAARYFPKHRYMFDGYKQTPHGEFPAYFVEVPGSTPQAKMRLYMPKPRMLLKQ